MTKIQEALKEENQLMFDEALAVMDTYGFENYLLLLTEKEQNLILSWDNGGQFKGSLKSYKGHPIITARR
jgi:L-rhamnose mutarotase